MSMKGALNTVRKQMSWRYIRNQCRNNEVYGQQPDQDVSDIM